MPFVSKYLVNNNELGKLHEIPVDVSFLLENMFKCQMHLLIKLLVLILIKVDRYFPGDISVRLVSCLRPSQMTLQFLLRASKFMAVHFSSKLHAPD